MPAECVHLWRWFVELSAARGSNGWGPNPISYLDIEAWSRLTRTIINPAEVRAIIALDQAFLTERAEADRAG